MQRTGLLVLLTLCLLVALFPSRAQDDENLLRDGSFEGQYTGRGRGDFNFPPDWNVWFADSPRTEVWMNLQPAAFPHRGPGPNPKDGRTAININKGFATFTIAVYQQVSVSGGDNLQARAYAWLTTCDIPDGADNCESNGESGAQVKIGIDPNGGTSPNDSDIVWSSPASPHNQWGEVSVSATATGGTVTLFLYATQSQPTELNRVYWDDARMTRGGEGGAAEGAEPTAPPFVAFVSPQGERDDGSIVHVVQAGDTIDSIAVAYGLTRADVLALNNISDPRIIQIGQELIIRPPADEGDNGDGEDAEATQEANSGDGGEESSGGGRAADETEEPQPTPTPAPPAPVVSVASGSVLPPRDPAALTASVCVLLFDDANQNRIQEEGEPLLAGGSITLRGSSATGDYETDGSSEPYCFGDLASGDYLASAAAPDGYGLTTPDQFRVRANPGVVVNVAFGAAQGVSPAAPPPPDSGAPVSQEIEQPDSPRRSPLMDNIGLIVFGLAGIVLIIGTGTTLFIRRR